MGKYHRRITWYGNAVLLMGIFGWKVAVLYANLGLVVAVAGGTFIEKLNLQNQVEEYIRSGCAVDILQEQLYFKDRMKYVWEQVVATAKKVAAMGKVLKPGDIITLLHKLGF